MPVSASIDPAWAEKTSGIKSCDDFRLRRTAMTTTTGSRAATAPLTLIRAVSTATRLMVRSRRRVRLSSPAPRIRSWPAQAVTPVVSSPALTMKREAMKMTAGSPKPPSAWPRVRTRVAHNASAVAMATMTTGSLFQMNRTTAAAMMVAIYAMGLNLVSSHVGTGSGHRAVPLKFGSAFAVVSHQQCEAAAFRELGKVDIFLDRVDLGLARADGDGRDAVLVEPIGIEAAVGER